MNNEAIEFSVKKVITKDLFSSVGKDKCIIDAYLEQSSRFNYESINKVSLFFLEACKKELNYIHGKGQILFFRENDYEKVLDKYLNEQYLSNGSSNGASHETVAINEKKTIVHPLSKKQIAKFEKQKHELEKKRIKKEQEIEMASIVKSVANLKWKKRIGVSAVHYDAEYKNRVVIFSVITSNKKGSSNISYTFVYGNKKIITPWNLEEIEKIIVETHPTANKTNGIIINTSFENSKLYPKQKRESVELSEEELLRLQRKKEQKEKRATEEEIRLEELKKKKQQEKERMNKLRLKEERMNKLRLEEERLLKAEKERQIQEGLQKLPKIGVRDFVVRRAVFRCMYDKHKVIDLDAAITIFDHENNEKLVSISAGYCQSCDIYFIMESTYESLKRKGIILCRISDEKSYMKNSFINGMKLAQESILMQYGYNVSQEEGLTETRRQKILAIMVDKHVLSRSEIISYLDFFINQRMFQSKFELAVSKWEADRNFISQYRVGEYSQYGVNAIYRR